MRSADATSGAANPRKLANSAAAAVAGAHAGLLRKNVAVIIDGNNMPVADVDDEFGTPLSNTALEQRYKEEEREAGKICRHFGYIKGLIATVRVEIEMTRQEVTQETYDPKGVVQGEVEVSDRSEENRSRSPPLAEAGAAPNMPVTLDEPSAGEGTSSNTSDRQERYEVRFGQTHTRTQIPPGKAEVVAATVRVPRSYFVQALRSGSPGDSASEPDPAMLDDFMTRQLADMRDEVRRIMAIKSDADVSVFSYNDLIPPVVAAQALVRQGGELSATSMKAILGAHGRQFAIGALAVVSLLMVLMMVRKGAPAPVASIANEPETPQRLDAGERLAGEVGEGEAMLDGMELDEDTVKAQQMIAQVSTMVKENPDAAASLVKRWLNRA
jgi:flagellar biosynthesis/type III secretory pathway M-ring protein FliF/YscJ